MDGLKSYFSLIDPRLLRHVKGKPAWFIELFLQKDYLSEDAFKARICGEKHPPIYYRELKSRTIKILQALVFASPPKGNSLVEKKYDFCQKKFTIGQKFLKQGQRKEGLRLIKQAYDVALEYGFLHLACELSSILYHEYTFYHPNKRKAKYYFTQGEKFLKDYTAEKRAEYQVFNIIGLKKRAIGQQDFILALDSMEKCKGESIKYWAYTSMLKVIYGLHIADYDLIIQSCAVALNYFENKKGVYSSHRQFFLSKKGVAHLAKGHYTKAEDCFIDGGKYTPKKSFNDYLLKLYRTINALHSGNYHIAYDIYRQHRYCKFEEIRQQFTLIEAYMCFLSHMGYLQLDKPFRIGKYLNQTFKEQSDKQGNNVIVLIAELLYYLARNKGKFIDRVEAINNYSYRHLTGKETRRAKRFINILCALPRANFNPIALERKAERHIQYLQNNPICMGESVDIEIIPFEVLLEMIMVRLGRKVA